MQVFNSNDPKHNDPGIFNCRLRKANKKFDELFELRCKRALDLLNKDPINEYEIDKALQAAIDMNGLESTHFQLVQSVSYNQMKPIKKLYLLERIHNVLPGRLHTCKKEN